MATYRGDVQGHWLRNLPNLSREEAKHFLLHDAHGRTLLRDTGADIDSLADHLVEASNKRAINKSNEVPKMDINKMNATLREVGEHGFSAMVQKYADSVRRPNETQAQAFNRVFSADDAEGLAIRKCWRISKGVVPADAAEREYGRGRSVGYASGALDDDEAAEEAEGVEDDALEELEELAADERKRNPRLSKAQAFAKAYSAHPEIAARERRQNRPRA
jgi:hypothetical protein